MGVVPMIPEGGMFIHVRPDPRACLAGCHPTLVGAHALRNCTYLLHSPNHLDSQSPMLPVLMLRAGGASAQNVAMC
eukprot:366971-Amphidinium_carterae.2